jgi:molybdopterin molybdotransferase
MRLWSKPAKSCIAGEMTAASDIQRIMRLTPLDAVIAAVDAAAMPVASREVAVATAIGRILAADVALSHSLPETALALRDGWAVNAELTADAGAYAPVPLPSARRVDVGDKMPPDADAVMAPDAVTMQAGSVHALAPVAPGEGVLPAGGDVAPGAVLLRQGRRITRGRAAVLAASGIDRVAIREPHIRIVCARPAGDKVIDAAAKVIADAVAGAGGSGTMVGEPIARAMTEDGADAVIVIGGTGSGVNDATVRTLAAAGEVIAHGIALYPGETTAFGIAAGRPVLSVPGRLDATLAVWHVLGRHLMMRLSGSREPLATRPATLTHKIASAVGVAELIPVACEDQRATPIASGYVPVAALARADGWILVPPESEGYPAQSEVVVRPFP